MNLKKRGWYDVDEHLVYFQILDTNNTPVWESTWADIRDTEDLREEVIEACIKHDISVDWEEIK